MGLLDDWARRDFLTCTALNAILAFILFCPYGGITWTAINWLGYTGVPMQTAADGVSFVGGLTLWHASAFYAVVYLSEIAFFDWLFFDGMILGIWESASEASKGDFIYKRH